MLGRATRRPSLRLFPQPSIVACREAIPDESQPTRGSIGRIEKKSEPPIDRGPFIVMQELPAARGPRLRTGMT